MADDLVALQLRAERLSIDKSHVVSGEVRVGKRVVSRNETIDVAVSHDELVIVRHAVADVREGRTIGDEMTICIALSRDHVSIVKQAFDTEEVEVGKRSSIGTVRVDETVRHEELVIDDGAGPLSGFESE